MKKAVQIVSGVFAIMLIAALFIAVPATAQAKAATPIKDAKFDVASSIKDNLKTYIGKDVVLHLRSGKTLQGFVKAIGDHMVHLEKLSGGRDFYDALVRIEDISAIEARFRALK